MKHWMSAAVGALVALLSSATVGYTQDRPKSWTNVQHKDWNFTLEEQLAAKLFVLSAMHTDCLAKAQISFIGSQENPGEAALGFANLLTRYQPSVPKVRRMELYDEIVLAYRADTQANPDRWWAASCPAWQAKWGPVLMKNLRKINAMDELFESQLEIGSPPGAKPEKQPGSTAEP